MQVLAAANRRRRPAAGRVQTDPEMAQTAPRRCTRKSPQGAESKRRGQPQWGPQALIGSTPHEMSREEAGFHIKPITSGQKIFRSGVSSSCDCGNPPPLRLLIGRLWWRASVSWQGAALMPLCAAELLSLSAPEQVLGLYLCQLCTLVAAEEAFLVARKHTRASTNKCAPYDGLLLRVLLLLVASICDSCVHLQSTTLHVISATSQPCKGRLFSVLPFYHVSLSKVSHEFVCTE